MPDGSLGDFRRMEEDGQGLQGINQLRTSAQEHHPERRLEEKRAGETGGIETEGEAMSMGVELAIFVAAVLLASFTIFLIQRKK